MKIALFAGMFAAIFFAIWAYYNLNVNFKYAVGEEIDSFNGVFVYFNGGINHISGRNMTEDGYNLGLKYQCVEFVKRYYYEHLNHKMTDSYGNAKDFFDKKLSDGEINIQRGLFQYNNPSVKRPEIDDIIVFNGTLFNRYGHIAIVSRVTDNEIEIIQQNPGPFGDTREKFVLINENGRWSIKNSRISGWLSNK